MALKEKTLQFGLIFGILATYEQNHQNYFRSIISAKSGFLPAESCRCYFESSLCGVKTDDNGAKVADVWPKVTHVCAEPVDIWAKLTDLQSKLVDSRVDSRFSTSAILDLILNLKPRLRSIVAKNL